MTSKGGLVMVLTLAFVLLIASTALAATVTINDGALWTRQKSVVVDYSPGTTTAKYYQISNDPLFWDAQWVEIPAANRSLAWDLLGRQGKDVVYMRFSPTASDRPYPRVYHDDIRYDTIGPRCWAYSTTVRYHTWSSLSYLVRDNLSHRIKDTIRITKNGVTKRLFRHTSWVLGGSRHWDWYCDLPRGRYDIVVKARDKAGNPQSRVGYAVLTVK